MRRLSSIPVLAVLMLGAVVAVGQQRGGRPASPPRFNAPPPQQQQQQQQRSDQGAGQRNPNEGQPAMQPRQGDRRFIFRGPGPHAGDWLRRHEDEPFDQQLRELENDPKFKQLTPQGQQQLRNRLNRFNSLTPQQRDRMLNNLDIIEHMTPQQEQRARAMFRDLRQMPEERRREVSNALAQLQEMRPEDRQKMIDSDEFRRNFSDKERDLIRGMSEAGLIPQGSPPRQ